MSSLSVKLFRGLKILEAKVQRFDSLQPLISFIVQWGHF